MKTHQNSIVLFISLSFPAQLLSTKPSKLPSSTGPNQIQSFTVPFKYLSTLFAAAKWMLLGLCTNLKSNLVVYNKLCLEPISTRDFLSSFYKIKQHTFQLHLPLKIWYSKPIVYELFCNFAFWISSKSPRYTFADWENFQPLIGTLPVPKNTVFLPNLTFQIIFSFFL